MGSQLGDRLVAIVLIALVLLVGCATPSTVDLDARWLPLKQIVNDPTIPAETFATYGDVIRGDVPFFLSLSADAQTALLEHEHVHAMHQAAMGLNAFMGSYRDPYWRLDEEKAGWTAEIHYARAHGVDVDVERIVSFFRTYQLPLMDNDVRAWVASVR